MAKLKPLRKDEDMEKVPTSEPILVELGPPVRAEGDEPEKSEPQRRMPEPADQIHEDDDDTAPQVKSLTEQLEAMKAAQAANDERVAKAERERADAIRLANENAARAQQSDQERDLSERDLISNSLLGAQAERDAAKAAYVKAFSEGDADAAANAQSKLARAEGKILTFEGAQAELAGRAEREAKEPKSQPQQAAPSFEQQIDQNPNLLPKEKEWLRSHPEMIMDNSRNQELGVGYQRAVRQGLIRGTEAYFTFLDEFMGYKKPEQRQDDDERTSIMAAPVTRQSPSNGNSQINGNQVYLSAEQRSMARSMGISDKEYAQQVQRLDQAKREDPERYPSRR